MKIITCKNCFKSYGKKKVIENFTQNFSDQIYVIKGSNGSGKSTLLKILGGFESFDEGYFKSDLANILFLTNESIGENFLTIKENIELLYHLHNITIDDSTWKAISNSYSDKQLDTLYEDASLGMSLKVGCSLIISPKKWDLIILDETLSGLDEPSRNIIIKYLENIVETMSTTVLIVSHNYIEKSIKSDHEVINL